MASIFSHQACTHSIFVDLDYYAARLFCCDHVAVIEDGDSTVGVSAGVMLKDGPDSRTHLEVALLAAQTPDDLPRLAVHFVHRASPAGRDDQVSARNRINGVDVEVVEWSRKVGRRPVE